MTDGGVEKVETNPYLKPEYLLDCTEEDLTRSEICRLVATIPDSQEYYPGCKEYTVTPNDGRTIAMLVVSPDTGKVYLKSRYGDARDVPYKARVMAEILWAIAD